MVELSYGQLFGVGLGVFLGTLILGTILYFILAAKHRRQREERARIAALQELDRIVLGSRYTLFNGRETNYDHPRTLFNRVKSIEEHLNITYEDNPVF